MSNVTAHHRGPAEAAVCVYCWGGHLLGVQNEVGVGGGGCWMQFVVPVFTFDCVSPLTERLRATHLDLEQVKAEMD